MSVEHVKVVSVEEARGDAPRVEVLGEALCTQSELQKAVLAGAITSGVVCALAGVGFGYLLGMRVGRE